MSEEFVRESEAVLSNEERKEDLSIAIEIGKLLRARDETELHVDFLAKQLRDPRLTRYYLRVLRVRYRVGRHGADRGEDEAGQKIETHRRFLESFGEE